MFDYDIIVYMCCVYVCIEYTCIKNTSYNIVLAGPHLSWPVYIYIFIFIFILLQHCIIAYIRILDVSGVCDVYTFTLSSGYPLNTYISLKLKYGYPLNTYISLPA